MCSLYSLRRAADEARNLFNYMEEAVFPPRPYVTPGSPIGIVRAGHDGKPEFALVRWGFVPSWAKEVLPGRPLINARSETVYEKASFNSGRWLLRVARRCAGQEASMVHSPQR
jgi:putative SOS response-associated peptidase YedK